VLIYCQKLKVNIILTRANVIFFLIAPLFLGLYSNISFALNSDKDQVLQIIADSVELNHLTGVAVYRQHVNVSQGTTHLTADKLTTAYDDQNHLESAIAVGNKKRATYRTQTDIKKPELIAQADTIKYLPKQKIVQLIGNAQASQGTDTFIAPQINYDIQNQIITSPPTEDGKTVITIQPK
jgi:lipopolysaccharide export system protein LptA